MTAPALDERLHAALREAGMEGVPESFSIAPAHQQIPRAVVAEIDEFLGVFDRVTTRRAWQDAVTAAAPPIARQGRREVCFFSAWDFHLPPERPHDWQLIECNDNGSGMAYAALIDRLYYELSGLGGRRDIEEPPPIPAFGERIASIVRAEAEAFFGASPPGGVLILEEADLVRDGRFRHELSLLRAWLRAAGLRAEIGSPQELTWGDGQLRRRGERVSFVINRLTDFHLEADHLSPLRAAYEDGSVYVAPNPFTYATRSDKRLLEPLSRPTDDAALGVLPEERALLDRRVPETRLLRAEDVEQLAREREAWFFKPCHGFAAHGVLPGDVVGRSRLRRLVRKGEAYVAQRTVPKSCIVTEAGVRLWTDLRVWAYRGERLLLSGRASRRHDTIDLAPPGGWMATYAGT